MNRHVDLIHHPTFPEIGSEMNPTRAVSEKSIRGPFELFEVSTSDFTYLPLSLQIQRLSSGRQ